jgi:hypothetical protein
MDGWISEAAVMNLATVILILSAALNGSRRTKLQWIMNGAVIALVLPLHALVGGYRGLAMSLGGAAAGVILSMPLHRARWMKRVDVSTSCAVGARLGPAGAAIALLIALGFVAVQHVCKARTTAMPDSLFSAVPFYPLMPQRSTRPSLAEIESQRILREDNIEGIAFGDGERDTGRTKPSCIPIIRVRDEVLPWSHKIALAALAVMMFGAPW